MSNASQPFDFSQFVPGFDFLKNLAGGAAAGAGAGSVPGIPSLASWVAPTLSVEEVDKRIQELKTVQYWLEQNGHALKATIQALEVQKMTLSTLRGMNVRMEDIASAFTKQAPRWRPRGPAPAA
jgi:ribosomal protein L15